jgi:signal transduction histidine kinase
VLRKHVDVLRRVSGQAIDLRVGDPPRLAGAEAAQVLRIAQEALGNAVRHSRARRIEVKLDGRVLVVADDGRGFDPGAVRGRRLGLTSMAERAAELGATLRVESAPGQGTQIRLELAA